MKKQMLFLVMILVLSMAPSAFATYVYPVSAGDEVTVTSFYPAVIEIQTGVNAGSSFQTFCLEKYELVYANGLVTYTVSGVDERAYNGGSDDADLSGDGAGDEISAETEWIYLSFLDGDLTSFSATLIQYAIWFLEDEIDDFSEVTSSGAVAASATSLVKLAQEAVAGADYQGIVKVMNLVTDAGVAQSMLVAPVPEPATLVLLGSALAGLAFYRRRKG